MQFSKKIEKCIQSPIRKFHPFAVAAEKQGKKVYHLNIGQPDVLTPEPFFNAVKNFNDPVVAYAPSNGIPKLIQAIKEYYASLNMLFEDKDILVTTGGSEALSIVFNCILDDDSEILIPEPFYPNYSTMVNLTGGKVVPIKTSPKDNYHYTDKEKIEKLITPKTRAMLFTNPGNPTGVVLSHEEMEMLVDIATKHDLYLIGDEAYREFIYTDNPKLESFAEFKNAENNIIVIDTVSKRFSACGARIGCIISRNEKLMAHALKICQARLSVATLEQLASAELYNAGTAYFASVRDEYRKRRDTVVSGLKKIPGVKCETPNGAFYLMAVLPVDDTDKFQEWLLTEFSDNNETVMYAPGCPFYATKDKGKNEIRIAYVNNCEYLARAVELLGKGIEEYNKLK